MPEDSKSFSDEELARLIKKSDRDAFGVLYARYFRLLFAFIYSRTRNPEITSEGVQEVFTRLWITRSRLDPDLSIKSYLFQIANNMMVDEARKNKLRKLSRRKLASKPEDPSNMRDIVIDLENALSELPPDLRNTLILHRRQGFTYQEIAEICGISKKTVEKQIGIALKKLRKLLNY